MVAALLAGSLLAGCAASEGAPAARAASDPGRGEAREREAFVGKLRQARTKAQLVALLGEPHRCVPVDEGGERCTWLLDEVTDAPLYWSEGPDFEPDPAGFGRSMPAKTLTCWLPAEGSARADGSCRAN